MQESWFEILFLHGREAVWQDVYACKSAYHAQKIAAYIAHTVVSGEVHPMKYDAAKVQWIVQEVQAA